MIDSDTTLTASLLSIISFLLFSFFVSDSTLYLITLLCLPLVTLPGFMQAVVCEEYDCHLVFVINITPC